MSSIETEKKIHITKDNFDIELSKNAKNLLEKLKI